MSQIGFNLNLDNEPGRDFVSLPGFIVDRGSKYTITAYKIQSEADIKNSLEKLKTDKNVRKATHNSYAARIANDGQIIELKADDGETGAGMVILRELRNAKLVNCLIVVTRWFGGVKLYADRFKHIQDGARAIIEEML